MSEVFLNGPSGRIQGKFHQSSDPNAPIALVLHSHPLAGGTMDNKVIYTLYKTFTENNFTTLRINFRGVGRSEGRYDNGIGELIDAATALDWLQANTPTSQSIWVSGFSFGSWIAIQLVMRRPEVTNFISAAPPVDKYDFSFLSPCPAPGLIIQGDKDSVVNEENVIEFVNWVNQQRCFEVAYHTLYGADHFFRNKLEELNKAVDEYIKSSLINEHINSNIKGKKAKHDRNKTALLID